MRAWFRLRWIAGRIANTLATSPTGCYAVAEFAAPWAELQSARIASPDRTPNHEEAL